MAKIKTTGTVKSQKMISPGIYSMWIQFKKEENVAAEAVPGQFISMYCNEGSRILPRPISICEIDSENASLRVVYRVAGKGTEEFSGLQAGDTLPVVGPLGNGFTMKEGTAVLIGGGIGVPPMLELAKQLSGKGNQVQVVLGYRDHDLFLKEEFEPFASVYVSTEDGSVGTKGNVIDAMRENHLTGDGIYSCGPIPMLRGVKAFGEEKNIFTQISLEEKMACGIGACLACVCQSKEKDDHSNVNNKRVCKDGPVFDAREIEL